MSAVTFVAIGVDPGPTPGIVALAYDRLARLQQVDVFQCSANRATETFSSLLNWWALEPQIVELHVEIERFVVSRRASRSSDAQAGETTRNMVGALVAAAGNERLPVPVSLVVRSASEVKPWATDYRLAAAGLAEHVKGMRHAKDAARHALFAAVNSGVVLDPFSVERVR